MTTAAGLTVPRTFFALFLRRGEHIPRIIPRRFAAAVGTFHLVQITFYQFVESFSAGLAFILQQRHFLALLLCEYTYYTLKIAVWQAFFERKKSLKHRFSL